MGWSLPYDVPFERAACVGIWNPAGLRVPGRRRVAVGTARHH